MGLSTIGAALSEDEGTIEDVLEPYLIANGYIERTARGRIATQKSYEHFKLGGLKDGLDSMTKTSLMITALFVLGIIGAY